MQPDLPRLIRELKNETCPQRVRDKVRGQIAAKRFWSGRMRFAIPAVFAVLTLLCCLSVWQWQARQKAGQQAKLVERTQVANDAADALGLVGSVLLDAGARSEKIISEGTVPPLRNSLETTKNKINQYVKL